MRFRINQLFIYVSISSFLFLAAPSIGQQEPRGGGGPAARKHTVTQSSGVTLVPSNVILNEKNKLVIKIEGGKKWILGNGIPAHDVGEFPNCGNPHTIRAQEYSYRVDLKPRWTGKRKSLRSGQNFGVAVNGIPFDPLAAEYYKGVSDSKWRYEALSGAVALGVDHNYAHVQPTGAYHYHGLPWGLLEELGLNEGQHSPIIGWAADGYPIYAIYGYASKENQNSAVIELTSSYQLKQGQRPQKKSSPGGLYDGTFVVDHEYIKGSGDLDECNGVNTKTPDFPDGTYAYFLTETWPVVPRCHNGVPDDSFSKGRGSPKGGVSTTGKGGPIPGCGPSSRRRQSTDRTGKQGSRGRSDGAPPHMVKAANKLGISVEDLHQALGPPPPNFERAAKILGITVKALSKAMGPPPN